MQKKYIEIVTNLHTVNPEECYVVAAVESEAHYVQREEIKVETNYAENKGGG